MAKKSRSPWDASRRRVQKQLRLLRLEAGLTQQELAAKLRLDQSYVSRYESGDRRLDLVDVAIVCRALGTDLLTFVSIVDLAIFRPVPLKIRKNGD